MQSENTLPVELAQTGDELRVVIGRIARRIKQLYETGEMTFSETSVLSRLHRSGSATPGALAEAEHVRPQAIVVIVNSLASRGLVARTEDPTDGRKVQVVLTEAGKQVLADKGLAVTHRMARILAEEFSKDELRELKELLPLLERLAGVL